jgi:CAAX prenyl protease-like protein
VLQFTRVATRHPAVPYVVPFVAYLGFLALHAVAPLPDWADLLLRIAGMSAVLYWFALPVLDLRVERWAASVLIGVAVFAIWIAADVLIPGYRHHWLFENAITGKARASLSADGQRHAGVLALRTIASAGIVPVVEELFWRAWLMRWLIARNFRAVPLGAYTRQSFWIVAILFASEHGPYWEVGLAAGIVYNWWMVRTKSLGDLVLTHAVTNACLSAYIIAAGKWEYWS